jgi:small RNA 2'-O-methyltransferase
LSTVAGSYTDREASWQGFDACAMVETIEHVPPGMLGSVEATVFGYYRPKTLVMTTPNAEFNEVFGLARHEFRHPDHRFEWARARFRSWASGVAQRNGYRVAISGIGEFDFVLGQPTQMAIFSRA